MRENYPLVYLNESALSQRWQLSRRTLSDWRWKNKGPAWTKFGRAVRYSIEAVEAWEKANAITPGSQIGTQFGLPTSDRRKGRS